MIKALGVAACVLLATLTWRATEPVDAMRAAARGLARALAPEQRAKCTFAFDDAERRDWKFVPGERKGIAIGELSKEQRGYVFLVLQECLHIQGSDEVRGVIKLEGILRDVEHNPARDPDKYYVSLFGDLEGAGRFGWRFEGHHLSLNFTDVEGSKRICFTPQFIGANPATVHGGPDDGLRVLWREEDHGRALVKSLDDTQRKLAILAGVAPADVILGPGRNEMPDSKEGIAYTDLTVEQQGLLRGIVDDYWSRVRSDEQGAQDREFLLADPSRLRFVWAGGLEPGEPHYYRIQGPRFAIEYDNTQNGANHIHTLWRDLDRDFGDPLREHHEREHK